MKIIDLLVKISKGEEVPEKIKWGDRIFKFNNNAKNYMLYDKDADENIVLFAHLFNTYVRSAFLNDEVEIIKDTPKKVERLEISGVYGKENIYYEFANDINNLQVKVNEIIDKLEELENKNDDRN